MPSAQPMGAWAERAAQQEEKAERERYQRELEAWVGIDDLGILDPELFDPENLPTLDWLVPGFASAGSVVLVAGDGGVGKSQVLLQLLCAAVLGDSWLDRRCVQAPALMLSCEDDLIPLLWRYRAICRHLGCDWLAPRRAGLQVWPRAGQDNRLFLWNHQSGEIEQTHLWDRLERRCRRDGVRYVCLDTITQCASINGNDENHVVALLAPLRRLAMAIDGTVILTKHPSLSGRSLGTGESGNTAWTNTVRSRFYLQRDKQTKGLLWRGMKSNYSSLEEDLPLKWDHGVFVVDRPETPERYWQA